jgi:hypothetical protein
VIGQAVKKSPPARKQKTCANPECATKFVPAKLGQKVCGWVCGLAIAPANQDKARKALAQIERKEVRARKEKLKSRAEHMREAQTDFNAFIRLRDADLPCISCDSVATDDGLITGSRWDAGHYRSVGACPELRFEPLNVHRQCVRCNRNLSGNAVEYRIRLVVRIGAEKLAWLEGPHEARKYTIDDLKAIKAECRAKIREMKKGEAA